MVKRFVNGFNWRGVLYSLSGLIVLAGLVLLLSFINTKSSEQACTAVHVIILGNESFIEQQDILGLLTEQYGELEGRTLKALPIHHMEDDLRNIPFVYSAVITVDMNGSLTIRIKQREAVVRIINEKGLDYYIDKQGYKMPVSLKYVPRIPVVNGHIAEPYNGGLDSIRSRLVSDIFKTAQYIANDSLWSSQVVQLYINEQQDIELVPRIGKQQIILGNADSLERKLEKLLLFYKRIVPKTGIDAYQTVNLKYAGQIICERSPDFTLEKVMAMQDSINQDSTKKKTR